VIVVFVNLALCASLFYTCFCRVVRTNAGTHEPVRLAFVVLASVAVACAIAPFGWLQPCLPAQPPGWTQITLLAAMVLVQALTARYWRDGVPCHFQRPGWEPTQAQGDDHAG
jgi:hypothetical protein